MLYCGLDIGKKSSYFCIVDSDRKVVGRGIVKTRRDHLHQWAARRETMRIVVEASSKSFWVAEVLAGAGHQVKVADPGKTKAIGASLIKNDKRDAHMLAVLCQADLIAEVRHVGQKTRLARREIQARDMLVRQRTQLVNHIRSALDSEGVLVGSCSSAAFSSAIPEDLAPEMRELVAPLIAALNAIGVQIAEYDKRLTERAKDHPIVRRLRTTPGVGELTALVFALVIRDPQRFDNRREVAAYIGLAPRLYESSQTSRKGRITKKGNRTLRWLLTMAANALLRTKTTSALKEWGLRLVERAGRKKAIVAIARKLAVTLWAMWRDERNFEPRVAG